jgi:hypothetical protein
VASSTLTTAAPVASGTPTHPTYATWANVWRWLVYVYEGSGPFLDGRALIAHPREFLDHTIQTRQPEEHVDPDTGTITFGPGFRTVSAPNPNPSKPSAKLLERRKLARYENVASPIVDHKLDALLRQPPTRRVKEGVDDHEWLEWAEKDVDGSGTSMDDFMRDAERLALIFGHAVIVMDRSGGEAQPLTRAQQGKPVLRLYSPLDMPDWLQGQTGELTAVKLYEVAPRESLKEAADGSRYRLRILDGTTFEVIEETSTVTGGEAKVVESKTIDGGEHGFGRLPVVILYAKKRALTPLIGQSVLYDPQLHVDNYNLTSELRELLRKQTFSILNIPLGTGPDALSVEQAQAYAGQTTGTTNVLFSGQPAQYLSADPANAATYQEERKQLLRTIYRLSNVPFESDSKDAEAEGSMQLKREDMNQVLSGYATRMRTAEMALTELWFRGTYGATGWEKEWARVEPQIVYPKTFDVTPFAEILEQADAALALPLGDSKTFMVEVAKQVLPLILKDAPQSIIEKIHKELESVPTPEEKRKQDLDIQMARFGASFEAKPGEEPPQEPAA